MKTGLIGSTSIVLILIGISVAPCAQVSGVVKSADGRPVQCVKIRAVDNSGIPKGEAVSLADGSYKICNLSPGQYSFKLDPMTSGVRAGDAVGYLSEPGLGVDWKVSSAANALDDAVPDATANLQNCSQTSNKSCVAGDPPPPWVDPIAIGTLGAGLVTAGTVGGLGAAGAFNGAGHPPVASPGL
jgi:hypothetical protein